MSMNQVVLHGSLGEQFGGPYKFDVRDPAEVFRALSCQLDGFKQAILADNWVILREHRHSEHEIDFDDLMLGMDGSTLHIVPYVEGSSSKGVGKVLGGIALIGLSFTGIGALTVAGFAIKGAMIGVGLSIALGGLSTLIAPTAKTSAASTTNDSFVFGDDLKASGQNFPVPLVYGGPIRVALLPIATRIVTNEYSLYNKKVSFDTTTGKGAMLNYFLEQDTNED